MVAPRFACTAASLLRVPAPFPDSIPSAAPKPSRAQQTIATRLPPAEVRAVEAAAEAAGQTCAEWMREAVLLHLKRPARKPKPAPDPTLLTELMGLRLLVHNLIGAAADLPPEKIQRIVEHADAAKEAKAEEILMRLRGEQKKGS